jgi:hypothetical protein
LIEQARRIDRSHGLSPFHVGAGMSRLEFKREQPNLARLEFDELEPSLDAAEDFLDAGLNPIIEGDDGAHLEANAIRGRIPPKTMTN